MRTTFYPRTNSKFRGPWSRLLSFIFSGSGSLTTVQLFQSKQIIKFNKFFEIQKLWEFWKKAEIPIPYHILTHLIFQTVKTYWKSHTIWNSFFHKVDFVSLPGIGI
jgi:hypothetical protein